jgi:hypothetical protein
MIMETLRKPKNYEILNEDWMAVITGFIIIVLTIMIYEFVPSLPGL